MSMPVVISVTGCSTWRRQLTSMNDGAPSGPSRNSKVPAFTYPSWRQARSTDASIASRVSGVSAIDGDSSTSFWWRRWMEHSRSPSVSTPPSRVAEHLDLDVPGRDERALEVEGSVPERRLCLGARGAVGGLEIRGRVDDAHALAAAAGGRLEQHREAELDGGDLDLGEARNAFGAGHERHAGGAHLGLRARLVAGLLHHLGRRPDEDEVALRAGAHEGGVLGEEAEARVDGLAARRLRGGDDVGNPQVAVRRRTAGRCRPPGRPSARAAPRARPSSRRPRPRRRARGARGSRGPRSHPGSRRGRERTHAPRRSAGCRPARARRAAGRTRRAGRSRRESPSPGPPARP